MTNSLLLHERTSTLVDKLTGKLPQALIVEGPSGIGVRAISKQLAISMGSPLLVIEPKKMAKGQMEVDHKEGNIIIEDIRRLYEQTRTRQPNAQVYILDTGERSMTAGAQNAFLKLLEEPREGLHFIIATHHVDQLLPTIRSRAQKLSLLPISDQQTTQLVASLGITDSTKQARLAFVGRGLPALTKRLASDEKAYEARVAIMTDAKLLISGSMYEKLLVVHKYKDTRADALTLIDDANHQLMVAMQKNPDQKLIMSIDNRLKARERIQTGGNIRLQLAVACYNT